MAQTTRTSTRARDLATDAPHLAGLEHAQQPRLQRERQLADLVEEQACRRRPARTRRAGRAAGAGERAALVAEQLALDQLAPARRRR